MVVYDNGPGTKCVGIVLKAKPITDGLAEEYYWLDCLWDDGIIEGIESNLVSFVEREKSEQQEI